LFTVVASGDTADVRGAIRDGAAIDERDATGRTPLMIAVSKQNHAVARLLIEHGAKVNARDKDGTTPLLRSLGMEAGSEEAFQLLIRAAPM
jgi:ankyrin repeat protein